MSGTASFMSAFLLHSYSSPSQMVLDRPLPLPSPAGLTRGSIVFLSVFSKKMDCRVKPGNDADSRSTRVKLTLLALDRRVHGDVAAPFVHQSLAKFEIVASHRHFCLALQLARPMAEIITVPWRLGRKRRQAQPLPDRPRALHELALRQRHRRVGALERGIDQHRRAFAAVARAARSVAWVLVRHH